MLIDDEGRLLIGKGINLKPYKPRLFLPREYMTYDEIRSNAGTDLILDVELYPNYFMCGFKHCLTGKYIKISKNFDPHFLSWLLHAYRTFGFHSLKYDLVILWASYTNQNPEFLKEISNRLILNGDKPYFLEKEYGFKIYKTIKHVDLIEVAPLSGSLKLYMARIHAPRIQDLPFPDTQYLNEEEIAIVDEYNCNDLDGTHLLKDFMKERLQLREEIGERYSEDVMSKSDAQIAEVIISKEVSKKRTSFKAKIEIEQGTAYKYSRPKYIRYATPELQQLLADVLKSDFIVNSFGGVDTPSLIKRKVKVGDLYFSFGIGGLHSCEEEVSYVANEEYGIFDRDVTSYYPDIILTLGLYPESLGPIFLDVYRSFKDERVVAKRNKQFTYDKGLKIFINGASGKLNSQYSNLYSPSSYIQMTLTGQLSILMLVEILVCNGFKVVSGNTDGIVIYAKRSDYEKLEYWIKFWEDETQFKTEETRYTGYYGRDVNAYFAVKEDGSVKVKGSYAEVGSQSGTQLDTNAEHLICSDAIKLFLSKNIPIEKTIRECKDIARFLTIRNVKGGAAYNNEYLGKVVRWYYSKNSTDCIKYVMSGNKVANTDGAMPCMDLPAELPTDIDYQKYIDIAKETLYDINYNKRPKQISFFD